MIITLRHIDFIASSFESGSTLHIDPSYCFALIHDPDLRVWIQSNDIVLYSESVYDTFSDLFRVRILADVEGSLATYYMLRWGNAQGERVYT